MTAFGGVDSSRDRRSDCRLRVRVAGPLAVLVLAVACLSPGQVRAEEAVECQKAAEKYLEAAKAAAPGIRENLIWGAIRQCPKDPRGHEVLGRHFEALNLNARAGRAYAAALKRLPIGSNVLREIGRLDPAHPKDALWGVVGFLIPRDKRGLSGAPEIFSLEKLMTKNPRDSKARLVLAKELTSIGEERMRKNQQKPRGEHLLARVVELVPAYDRARNMLVQTIVKVGEYHFNGKWYDKAAIQYKKALVYAPNDPRLHLRLAEAYTRFKGRDQDALRHFRKADAVFAQRAVTMTGEERASFRQRIQRGLDSLDEKRPVYRNRRGAKARELGKVYMAKEDPSRAAAAFQEAIAWLPGDALLHFDLAMVLKRLKGPRFKREAVRQFERALALFRTKPPPEVAKLSNRFQKRIEMEIAHLSGGGNSLYYLMQQVALGVRERAIELSLFILVFAGIAVYLLRAGLRLSGPDAAEGSYPNG